MSELLTADLSAQFDPESEIAQRFFDAIDSPSLDRPAWIGYFYTDPDSDPDQVHERRRQKLLKGAQFLVGHEDSNCTWRDRQISPDVRIVLTSESGNALLEARHGTAQIDQVLPDGSYQTLEGAAFGYEYTVVNKSQVDTLLHRSAGTD